jgi:hypothetical protein
MKRVELYGEVRRAVYVEGLSRREAARRFGYPRTVAKMLAFSVPPGYRRSRPPVRPKLDPFVETIERILEADKGPPAKQQYTRETDLRAAARRARVRRWDHYRESLRARTPPAAARDVRAITPRSWTRTSRLWGRRKSNYQRLHKKFISDRRRILFNRRSCQMSIRFWQG